MLKRLIAFYHKAISAGDVQLGECWLHQEKHEQKSAIEALKSRDEARLEALLHDYKSGTFGLDHAMYEWAADAVHVHLHNLLHLLGILPVFNPEQPHINNHSVSNPRQFQKDIESLTRTPLAGPNSFGFDPSAGIPYRYLFYVAASYIARCQLGRTPRRILEVGAGFGDLGVIAHFWGSKYAVIDLPQTAVLSAHLIASHVGQDEVWLYGEPDAIGFADFYPANDYAGVSVGRKFDLVWNSDSLPEMTTSVQDLYLELFRNVIADDGLFFSVNHEACNNGQSRVFDAVKRNGGFYPVARFPFMLRTGYMVEIFRKR